MDTFGEKLRSVRDSRGQTIEAASASTGVDIDRLRALEANDFDSLPGEDVLLASLRSYAAFLGVDADLMIEDYRRERKREPPSPGAPDLREGAAGASAELEPPRPTHDTPLLRFALWPTVFVVLVVAVGTAWWLRSGSSADREPQTFHPTMSADKENEAPEWGLPAVQSLDDRVDPPAQQQAREPVESAEATTREPEYPVDPDGPVIDDYGVGTGIENRQLVGEGDRFREQMQVWFWTHVEGADPGDRIDHVWLHDGVEALRVTLRIDGPNWRTHSAKTLRAGSAGEWVVEARDEAGRVLARETFVCEPPESES